MAWKKRGFRRKRRTHWAPPPYSLSHISEDTLLRDVPLERLAYAGAQSLTWAATPVALTEVQEDATNPGAKSLIDESTGNVRTRVLRCVGMFRPVAGMVQLDGAQDFDVNGCEIRYAFVRGDRIDELGSFDPNTGPGVQQPDLFNGTHLASERIAFIRPFVQGLSDPPPEELGVQGLFLSALEQCQWWNNVALAHVDWKSSRLENEDSGIYFLRQVRFTGESTVDQSPFVDAKLYDMSYIRVLRGG